ncbi:MAG: GAF domain-containing protein [Pseudomonadota bacterium]|nr:GAF domain-containing protein [Pseudomonadota bacterium]
MPDSADLQLISGRLERGEIDSAQFLEQLMRYVAGRIGCSRAGLRLFMDSDHGRVSRCVAMFDSALDRMVSASDIAHGTRSPYIERLQRDGSVSAPQALLDPVATGALHAYLVQAGVASLMDTGFSVNGVLFGTFCCEQQGEPVEWSQRQLQQLRKISSRASLSLMHVVNAAVDTAPGALWESSTPNRLATMPMPLDPPLESD